MPPIKIEYKPKPGKSASTSHSIKLEITPKSFTFLCDGEAPSRPLNGLPLANVVDPAFELSLARTAYNYMRSYPHLDAVPLCASVPDAEAFTLSYNALVLRCEAQIAENFLLVAGSLVNEQFREDFDSLWNMYWYSFEDIKALFFGIDSLSNRALAEGPTAVLKSALYEILRKIDRKGSPLLLARSELDFRDLIKTLPQPQVLTVESADWMPKPGSDRSNPLDLPCEQDWFFGYLQVAGFNTTNLRGVEFESTPPSKAVALKDLLAKLAITERELDGIFQDVVGDRNATVEKAVADGSLFVCDYSGLRGNGKMADKESDLHGRHRYLPGPIAIFFWNENHPSGFPPGYRGNGSTKDGILQPVAIQLLVGKPETLFSPGPAAKHEYDHHGWKWKIAKYFVNVACAIQHESVAHLGECHFIMESIIVATHRTLTKTHPVYRLLEPHMRFTLSINSGALSNLVVPGGVVATNVGPAIGWTLTLVNDARKAWRWDENNPERSFALRGVSAERSIGGVGAEGKPADRGLVFPFRDDTLLIWNAIKKFVKAYVEVTYKSDADVKVDQQLGAWFEELTSDAGAGFKDLAAAETRDDLVEILAQIIYTAGPLHASVNYAQYPLGAFMPCIAATIYKEAPTRTSEVHDSNYLDWFPPLDVALYTLSFEYLLSSVQYDVLGQYAESPQVSYFADLALETALQEFQRDLAVAEVEIRRRNEHRPMPYPYQLPSRIPNSISI